MIGTQVEQLNNELLLLLYQVVTIIEASAETTKIFVTCG